MAKVISKDEIEYILSVLSYNPNTGNFTWNESRGNTKAGNIAGTKDNGYIRVRVNNKFYQAHRLAFIAMGQPIPEQVDHINGVRDDNRWANLRPCNNSQNQQNSRRGKNNKSGYKGVHWDNNTKRWASQIYVNNKRIRLGHYDCPKKAHDAYCVAAREYHGEFANTG